MYDQKKAFTACTVCGEHYSATSNKIQKNDAGDMECPECREIRENDELFAEVDPMAEYYLTETA